MDSTELEIVYLAKAGDAERLSQLVELCTPRAYVIAYTIVYSRQDAEEAVQEALITLCRSLGRLRRERSFRSWFGRIVVNSARQVRRRRMRRDVRETMLQEVHASEDPVSRLVDSMDLMEAVSRLSEIHRLVIVLYYLEDMDTKEVARVVGRAPGSVRRILSEAYGLLRQFLKEEETP